MTDRSDKPPQQDPAAKPQGKDFLTSLLTWFFYTPGTKRIRRSVSLPIAIEDLDSEFLELQFNNEVVSRLIAGDLEYQAINGDGNRGDNKRGPFLRPAKLSGAGGADRGIDHLTCERGNENLLEFYRGALAKYRSSRPAGARSGPTHIILPVESKEQLMKQKKQSGDHPFSRDLDKSGKPQILASEFVPKGRGLVLTIDEIELRFTDILSLRVGPRPKCLLKGYSTMSITYYVNLFIKYPQSIMILEGLRAAKEGERSQEAQELLEERVVESKLPLMKEALDSREKNFDRSREILRCSKPDCGGGLDLSTACSNDVHEVQKELQSCYKKIQEIDRLVEATGNKDGSAFIIAKYKKDRDTYEHLRHQDWGRRFSRKEFFFRGQSGKWPVTSSLYRSLRKIGKGACLPAVEKRILTAARYVRLPHTPESEIFADLQHFGGMTNYIDFTANFTIALYFACKDNLESDGKVFMIRRRNLPIVYPIGQAPKYENASNRKYAAVAMAVNHLNIHRAMEQRNVFIRPRKGYIASNKFYPVENLSDGATEDFMVLTIKAEEKKSIMGYLRREGGLEEMTFFEDIMGIIERDRRYEKPCATKEDILCKFDQYDNMEREIRRQRAIVQKMSANDCVTLPLDSPHYYIGRILYSRGCYAEAVDEFLRADPCYKPLAAPHHLYLFLASAYVKLGKYRKALEQLTNVVEEGRKGPYSFIAAEALFWMGDYQKAWDNIRNAVEINESSMACLRLKILIAHKLNNPEEVERCANKYFHCCAYDPEIISIRNQHRLKNQT